MKNLFSIAALASLFLFSACLGPSAKDSQCSTTLTQNGQSYTGTAKDDKQSKLNACNKFCLEHDPKCDAIYAIWKDSDAGKVAGQISKQESMFKNRNLLDCVTLECAPKCAQQIVAGDYKAETSCQ